MVNVGNYTIHGSYGNMNDEDWCYNPVNWFCYAKQDWISTLKAKFTGFRAKNIWTYNKTFTTVSSKNSVSIEKTWKNTNLTHFQIRLPLAFTSCPLVEPTACRTSPARNSRWGDDVGTQADGFATFTPVIHHLAKQAHASTNHSHTIPGWKKSGGKNLLGGWKV